MYINNPVITNTDGIINSSFANNGILSSINGSNIIISFIILTNNTILVQEKSKEEVSQHEFTFINYNNNGKINNQFGEKGDGSLIIYFDLNETFIGIYYLNNTIIIATIIIIDESALIYFKTYSNEGIFQKTSIINLPTPISQIYSVDNTLYYNSKSKINIEYSSITNNTIFNLNIINNQYILSYSYNNNTDNGIILILLDEQLENIIWSYYFISKGNEKYFINIIDNKTIFIALPITYQLPEDNPTTSQLVLYITRIDINILNNLSESTDIITIGTYLIIDSFFPIFIISNQKFFPKIIFINIIDNNTFLVGFLTKIFKLNYNGNIDEYFANGTNGFNSYVSNLTNNLHNFIQNNQIIQSYPNIVNKLNEYITLISDFENSNNNVFSCIISNSFVQSDGKILLYGGFNLNLFTHEPFTTIQNIESLIYLINFIQNTDISDNLIYNYFLFGCIRLLENGDLDKTFGGFTNISSISSPINQQLTGVVFYINLQQDDNIILFGFANIDGLITTIVANYYNHVDVLSPICFPKNTPILTDQGIISIQKCIPNYHSIRGQPIQAITSSRNLHNNLVCFFPNSLERNLPTHTTMMTMNHSFFYKNKKYMAKEFLGNNGVNIVKIEGNPSLYNILLSKYSWVDINGLKCETLDPKNVVASLYNSYDMTKEERHKKIHSINQQIQKEEMPTSVQPFLKSKSKKKQMSDTFFPFYLPTRNSNPPSY
jgi:hypothetical protein